MAVLVTCKFDDDPIENEGVTQYFLHNKETGKIFGAQGRVTPKPVV